MLGHGPEGGSRLKKPLDFLGEELGLSVDEEESSAAWLLLRLVSEGQLRCLAQLISWLVRKLPVAGSSRRLERTIPEFDALEAHVRLAHFCGSCKLTPLSMSDHPRRGFMGNALFRCFVVFLCAPSKHTPLE